MASKKGGKCKRTYYQAKLVTNVGTCVFCQRAIDDEIIYGKLYAIGDIQCHYFCALLSCCLIQKGNDEEGLFGFLYPDILAEVERSKKHRCSYCNREGANLGCSVAQCRKQFHLPCGREKDAVSLFYGNYKSFCAQHAPKQKVVDSVMSNVKMRIAEQRRQKNLRLKPKSESRESGTDVGDTQKISEILCVICYEQVEAFPSARCFWPPCCARDAWFHRSCLQRMALSAGMHYLKCPLCNDKDEFYKAVVGQGYYVPDRDAAWELEQNAFAEIYERPVACGAATCSCPGGRDHDSDAGLWDIKLCILCGSTAAHAGCADGAESTNIYICKTCKPAAPSDLEKLIVSIEKVQLQEQVSETVRRGPVMPCRMSLRRTKPLNNSGPSSSRNLSQSQYDTTDNIKTKTDTSRLELNLKKPVRRIFEPAMRIMDNVLLSPIKMLEQGFSEKLGSAHGDVVVDAYSVLEKLREKLKKPRPLVAKKRIINNILDELLSGSLQDPKSKEALKEWNSPKKTLEVKTENCKEHIEDIAQTKNNNTEELPLYNKDIIISTPEKPISLQYSNITNEKVNVNANDDFKCNFKHKHIEGSTDGSKLQTAIDFAIDAYNKKKRKLSHDDMAPNKKQKINCSLKRKENNPIEMVTDQQSNQFDLDVTTDSESAKLTRIKHVDVKKKLVENNDSDICNVIVDNVDKPLEEVVSEKMKNVINCDLKRKPKEKSVIVETNLGLEKNNIDITKTRRNIKHKGTKKFEERAIKLAEEKSIEKIGCNMNKTSSVDKKFGSFQDISTKKKTINCSLKRKPGKKVVVNTTGLELKNRKSDIAETKWNLECERSDNLEERVVSFIKEECIQEGVCDVEKVCMIENELESPQDIGTKKKIPNCNLKRKPVSENATDFALKNITPWQQCMEDINKDIDKNNEFMTTIIDNKARKQIKKKRKESCNKVEHSHKSRKGRSNVKSHKKRNKRARGLKPDDGLINVTLDDHDKKLKMKYRNKHKKKLSIQNKDIKVKIKWKKQQLKLKIMGKKEKKKKLKEKTPKVFKQYILKYSPELTSSKEMIMKPESDITPVKRKYIKMEKNVDNMVQTNISSFFKATPKFN